MTEEEKAIKMFNSGFNCSQSVVSAFAEKLNFDEKLALKISTGFGAGMGRLQETCGAVTGAFMALGIYNCNILNDNAEIKKNTYKMIQNFTSEFKLINKTINCRELLGVDLNTDEGQKIIKDQNLHGTVCEKCIKDAVKIVNSFI